MIVLMIASFCLCFAVIAVSGIKLANIAKQLADLTGWGEAVLGAVFVGAATSLSGSVLSITAAFEGHPQLAVGNATGGIAVQTAFLAIADMFYRKANLEHAAASQENLMQSSFLILFLVLPLIAATGPEFSFAGIHPVSFLMMAAYVLALRLISASHQQPMWSPRMTRETKTEELEASFSSKRDMSTLWLKFLIFAGLVGASGWLLSKTGVQLAELTGFSETYVGGLFTAVITSVPELVVAIAAVKRGALTLAVGDIIGGNIFDTLIIAASDMAYRVGSIYHVLPEAQLFLFTLTLLLAIILLIGLLQREKHGIANIGLESVLVLVFYLCGFVVLSSMQ